MREMTGQGSSMLWGMASWESPGPAIHVDLIYSLLWYTPNYYQSVLGQTRRGSRTSTSGHVCCHSSQTWKTRGLSLSYWTLITARPSGSQQRGLSSDTSRSALETALSFNLAKCKRQTENRQGCSFTGAQRPTAIFSLTFIL